MTAQIKSDILNVKLGAECNSPPAVKVRERQRMIRRNSETDGKSPEEKVLNIEFTRLKFRGGLIFLEVWQIFTGIIEEIGRLKSINGGRIEIYCEKILSDIKIGDSISTNGICLKFRRKLLRGGRYARNF